MSKISALTSITGANVAAGDLFTLVDVSDTTMATSGTNKSITRAELAVAVASPGLGFKTGEYYGSLVSSASNITMTNNRTYYTPFEVQVSTLFDQILIRSHSNFSGTAVVRLGIYNNANGGPSTVKLDAGTVSVTVLGTSYAITISETLAPGWYWLAANSQTNATTNTFVSSSTHVTGVRPTNAAFNFPCTVWMQDGVSGAFATASGFSETTNAPLPALRAG